MSQAQRFTLAGACTLLLLTGCGRSLEDQECERLLARYVELLTKEDRPGAGAAELLRLQEEARLKAARDPAFAECSSRVSRGAFECALEAVNADRLEQCLL